MNSFSIIVPVYNVEKYLNKCLESLVNQTYKDYEIIIVNNGSTDESQKIINNYKETGKKLNNTPAQYKEEFPWLKEVDSLALANAQMNLNKAYNNFWSNRKHFGKPRFKSKKAGCASYSTNNQKGSVRIEGNRIKLPKIGWVKLCLPF